MNSKHKILATSLLGIASFGVLSESTFASNTHTVVKGDTLYNISVKYKTTVSELQKINKLTNTNIAVGQKLIISQSTSNTTQNNTPTNQKMVNATSLNLRSGAGTNFSIVTTIPNKSIVNVISNSNGWSKISYKNFTGYVSSDYLINVPTTNSDTNTSIPNTNNNSSNTTTTYTVVKGDTLFSISKKFNVTVSDVTSWNKLSSTEISIGQKLLIKSPTTTPNNNNSPSNNNPPTTNNKTYSAIVISSDNLNLRSSYSATSSILTSIPKNTIVSITEEIDGWGKTTFNGKTGYVSLTYVSKDLKTPTTDNSSSKTESNYLNDLVYDKNDSYFNISNQYHIVKSGDSLNSISQKYNVSVSDLKTLNKLSSNLINVGDLILISKKSPFILPTTGTASSQYGERWGTVHYGIDIANKNDVPVNAAYNGVVERVENKNSTTGWGNYVRIKHTIGGKIIYTLYAHLKESSITVKVGDVVSIGQKIGMMGNTGNSTGQHLHIETYENGNVYGKDNVNPLKYFFLK